MKKSSVQFEDRVTLVTDLLKNHKGRMFTAWFLKQDNSLRKINGRFGVFKGTNGKGMNHDPAEKGHHIIAEVVRTRGERGKFKHNRVQYRTVNLNTLQKLKFNGKTLIARESSVYV